MLTCQPANVFCPVFSLKDLKEDYGKKGEA